ncbi:hydroxyisourate hydrolase [Frateuria aurantia]
MSRLTTHILDTTRGVPAAGVKLELFRVHGSELRLLQQRYSNADGRCEQPLLQGLELVAGAYQLHFHIGDYFAGGPGGPPRFLDVVVLAFAITDTDRPYHLPLLCSPWSYSTYRGS